MAARTALAAANLPIAPRVRGNSGSGRRWVPKASTYSGAPSRWLSDPSNLSEKPGVPSRTRGGLRGSEAETSRRRFAGAPPRPATEKRARPPAPLTCSAMIPKSPKQACCTKFRLSTRTQPAGRESGEAQGCCSRRGHATHLASLPGLLVQQRPGGPPQEMSACRRTAHGHRPRTHIGCTVKRIPGYRERARSQSAATRGARTG